ncbi:hypothetical protein [Shinella zoogloeoides]|uniref:hypothetical protein n=1 Tax=Shinella zoogloeoides TaxID=352475 RepID=UPI001F597DAC|nr:hypothetical protein [Shinella zoogloeoides]
MRRKVVFCLAMSASGAANAASICIDGSFIFTGDTRVISIYDEVCKVDRGNFNIVGGGYTHGIEVCFNDSGNASVIYRNVTNNGPTVRAGWLKDGDCIKP